MAAALGATRSIMDFDNSYVYIRGGLVIYARYINEKLNWMGYPVCVMGVYPSPAIDQNSGDDESQQHTHTE